jgi:signal transduction histidine kinase
MRLGVNGAKLEAEIADDGRGINGSTHHGDGHGLNNMRSRARDLGGELTVMPGDQGGTRVQLLVPVR